jgi:hypothetical protein
MSKEEMARAILDLAEPLLRARAGEVHGRGRRAAREGR